MTWWIYDQLVRGCGCPTCGGDFEPSEARDSAWHRSVQYLADGSITGDPYKGWPAPTWPKYCYDQVSGKPRYRGELEEPWLDLIPETLKKRFADKAYRLGAHPRREDMDEPKLLKLPADRDSRKWAGIWVLLQEEKISGCSGAPMMERCNGIALQEMLGERPEIHWYLDDDTGNFWLHVAYIRYGEVYLSNGVTTFIDQVEHALEAHPLLDDDYYSEMESEVKQEALEEIISDTDLAEWAGMSDEVLRAYLQSRSDAILAEIELDQYGAVERRPDGEFFRKLLAPVAEPVHYEILRSVVNPECILLRQKSWDILTPWNRSEPVHCTGLLIFDARQGPRASPEVAPSDTVPICEFTKGFSLNYVKWSTLGYKFQSCILDLISDGDPDAVWNWEFWPHDHN